MYITNKSAKGIVNPISGSQNITRPALALVVIS